MAEITRQRTGEFLQILFRILIKNGEGLSAREALSQVSSQVNLSPYESGNYESGGQRFEKIIRFATVDCVKAGWMEKNKGRWKITELGVEALKRFKDPESFYREAVRLYGVWKRSQPENIAIDTEDGKPEDISEVKLISITYEQAEEQAWNEIESYLQQIQPYVFQDLVAGLLKAMGYFVSWVAPPGKDGGIDILALSDPLGTKPPRIKVQVKRQKELIRVEDLRSFMAVIGDSDIGLFVSLGGFTKDTRNEARTQEKRKITLLDLEQFLNLWIENYNKLSEEVKGLLPLKPIYFLAPKV